MTMPYPIFKVHHHYPEHKQQQQEQQRQRPSWHLNDVVPDGEETKRLSLQQWSNV